MSPLTITLRLALLAFASPCALHAQGGLPDAAFEAGRYDEAARLLTEAIAKDSGRAGLWQQRARARREAGAFDLAIADYSTALQLDPTLAPAYVGRAATRHRMQQPDSALADIGRARALGFADPQVDLLEGMSLVAAGRSREAVPVLDRFVKASPEAAAGWYFRGLARSATRDDKGAVRDFDEAIARGMPGPEPYVFRAQSKFRAGDGKGACTDLAAAGERGDEASITTATQYCR
ncbi:MAG TPA: tetratricopeptide repeat protein [Gemmatimonadales bacterium]|nr:tetratricopeptide repeat protein [Gemmatimonadales bacterium]